MNSEFPANASIFARLVFFAALFAGFTYLFAADWTDVGAGVVMWKGFGVWLLALYAMLVARTIDGWLITAVMAMGAAGDVLIESDLIKGAMAFAAGHVVAIALYARNRRNSLQPSQLWLALLLVPATAVIGWALPADRSGVASIVVYSLFLGTMAALAWTSRFPRYRTGIGAMLFLISDLLIFARMGPLEESGWVNYAIWLLYFAGQVLIVLGVTQTLPRKEPRLS